MIWFRPPVKYRAWWSTKLCENYGCAGLAARLWGKHLVPLPHYPAENDRDHCNW